MTKLLYIEASPRKERSHSIAVAKAYLEQWRGRNPEGEIDMMDLWDGQLAEFDAVALEARTQVAAGGELTEAMRAAWQAVTETAARVQAADVIVISSPMWNFMVPYVLKQLMDVMTHPGIAFKVTEEGQFQGLLTSKSAVVLRATGGDYTPGTSAADFDFFRPYLTGWLGFVGIEDVAWLDIAPLEAGPEIAAKAREDAIGRAIELANK